MKLGYKILIGIGAAGVLTVAGFGIASLLKPKGTKEEEKAADDIEANLKDTVGSNETTTQTKIVSDNFPLKIDRGNGRGGSEGLNVGKYQLALNYLYGASIPVDGKMGEATKKASLKYLPISMYNSVMCNTAQAYFNSDVCNITKNIYDYLILQIAKKDNNIAAKFVNYVLGSADYKKLLTKYK